MTRALLIEPDAILAGNIGRLLSSAGIACDWQTDPQAAMDSADARKPDVIILDLLLADRSGVEFLHELRSYPDWYNIPVILNSHLSAEELRQSTAGFDRLNVLAYHYKPHSTAKELVESIIRVLQPKKV